MAAMLVVNPGGGVFLLSSVDKFLERGRRGSGSEAQVQERGAEGGKRAPPGGVEGVRRSGVSWSRGLGGRRREGAMAEEGKKGGSKQPKMVENLRKRTHFSRQEVEALVRIYRELLSSCCVAGSKAPPAAMGGGPGLQINAGKVEGLDRIVFRELVHNAFDLVTEEMLIDRIFCAFDRNNDGAIKLEQWICGLSTFLRGTLEERAAFCFLVYDMNADGYIARDEMMSLLRNCLMKSPQDEDPEEGVRDLVELVLRKMDADKDGKVSYEDFLGAVRAEPLLLEAFGQCLPTEAACQTFMATLRG